MQANKKKKLSVPLLLFCILMVITVLLCAAVAGLWLHGRNTMTTTLQTPNLPPAPIPESEPAPEEESEAAVPADTPKEEHQLLEEHLLQYNGKYYKYNEHMCNVLLLGIDADSKPAAPLPYGSDIQADVIVLAALDLLHDEITLISLNRDIMCSMEVLDQNGNSLGFTNSQLAISYAHGDGLQKSCKLTSDAVSSIFYGLQIHGYGAFYLGGVATLNDALGGVTVNILDDYPFSEMSAYRNMIAGQDVTLTGPQAKAYIQCRQPTEDGNALRMQRQKQYMLALVSQAMSRVKEDPAQLLSLYRSMDDYILTDLDISRIMFLGIRAASMTFSGDIINLKGQSVLSENNHMEMTVDQAALYELMLDVFYQEVTP